MEITILPPIDFLDLQRLHEALRPGIVVGIARPAHADRDPAFFQPLDITRTCILHPTIGVMYQSEFWLSAVSKACWANSLSSCRLILHPTTRREYTSRITAK